MPINQLSELVGHHLKYEIDMLVGTFTTGLNLTDPNARWVADNALKESFCVHARALLEFFQKAKGAKKYANAGYKPFPGVPRKDLKNYQRLLNNQVMHLLEGRTADEARKISDPERKAIVDILRAEVDLLKSALKPKYAGISIPSIPEFVSVSSVKGTSNEIAST